jgi:hypothetical protein
LPLVVGAASDGTSDGEEDEGEDDTAFGGVTSLSGTILFVMGTAIYGLLSCDGGGVQGAAPNNQLFDGLCRFGEQSEE